MTIKSAMKPLLLAVILSLPFASSIVCSGNTTAAEVVAGINLSGQMHVLTGGDSGIGYQTALALASANATLIIASHDPTGAGANAATAITAATGNDKITIVGVDLSSLESVGVCAATISDTLIGQGIDVLICDAGIDHPTSDEPYALTQDGFDETMQVNLIGHAKLIDLLLPLVRARSGRVIHVSSAASYSACAWGNYDSSCTELANIASEVKNSPTGNNTFSLPASNYALSKYSQVFHAAELAKRESSIMAFSLHPGLVDTPLYESLPPDTLDKLCKNHLPGAPCPLTAAEGAATSTYLASAPADDIRAHDGAFYYICLPVPSVRTLYATLNGIIPAAQYQADLFDMIAGWTQGNV